MFSLTKKPSIKNNNMTQRQQFINEAEVHERLQLVDVVTKQ